MWVTCIIPLAMGQSYQENYYGLMCMSYSQVLYAGKKKVISAYRFLIQCVQNSTCYCYTCQCWVTSLQGRCTALVQQGVQVNRCTTTTQHASLLYNNGASVSLYGIFTWCKENACKEQEDRVIKRKKTDMSDSVFRQVQPRLSGMHFVHLSSAVFQHNSNACCVMKELNTSGDV